MIFMVTALIFINMTETSRYALTPMIFMVTAFWQAYSNRKGNTEGWGELVPMGNLQLITAWHSKLLEIGQVIIVEVKILIEL
jgi:hypothetical protein